MPFMHSKILSLLMVVLLVGACQDEKADKTAGDKGMHGVPVRVESPQKRMLTEWKEFTGRFQAQQRVEVRARVSGYLDEIKFEDGQMVEKGDVLFVIDQRPFNIALAIAQARFDAANNEHKRAKALRKSKAISEEDYDERLQAMRIAQAELDKAKLDLEFSNVTAPISGRISNNRIDVGNVVNGEIATNATLLTTIVSTSPIEFYFEASETDVLNHLRNIQNGTAISERGQGMDVFLKLQDEDAFKHKGKINFADNALSEDTGTVIIRAEFENKDNLFTPGMFARLRLAQGDPKEKIIIPQNIVGTEMTRKYVYALNEENKATRKYITLGHITEDGLQIVRDGLTTDDRIVVGGLHMVQPGATIIPIDAATANTSPKDAEPAQESK